MSTFDFIWIIAIARWLLIVGVSALILYWVVRLAVTHALRSHRRWTLKQPGE